MFGANGTMGPTATPCGFPVNAPFATRGPELITGCEITDDGL